MGPSCWLMGQDNFVFVVTLSVESPLFWFTFACVVLTGKLTFGIKHCDGCSTYIRTGSIYLNNASLQQISDLWNPTATIWLNNSFYFVQYSAWNVQSNAVIILFPWEAPNMFKVTQVVLERAYMDLQYLGSAKWILEIHLRYWILHSEFQFYCFIFFVFIYST